MPIYEYQCTACGHKLEKLQKISDAPLQDCPACAQPDLRKLVSTVAFRLKGGGWYETDFKDEKSRKNVAKEDGKAAPADTGKADGGADRKKDNGNTADGAGVAKQTKSETGSAAGSTTTSSHAG